MNPSNCLNTQWWRRSFLLSKEKFLWSPIIPTENSSTRKIVACENSCFSSLMAAGDILHFVSSSQNIPVATSEEKQLFLQATTSLTFRACKQMHVNFTVPEQLCRPTITSPLLLRLTSYWQVLLTSQTTTRLMGCSGTIGHQQIFNPWKGWLQEGT